MAKTIAHRALYIAAGIVSLALGVAGCILPIVPGFVFFIFAIGFFARSSERLRRWLLRQEWVQKMMKHPKAKKWFEWILGGTSSR